MFLISLIFKPFFQPAFSACDLVRIWIFSGKLSFGLVLVSLLQALHLCPCRTPQVYKPFVYPAVSACDLVCTAVHTREFTPCLAFHRRLPACLFSPFQYTHNDIELKLVYFTMQIYIIFLK